MHLAEALGWFLIGVATEILYRYLRRIGVLLAGERRGCYHSNIRPKLFYIYDEEPGRTLAYFRFRYWVLGVGWGPEKRKP